MRIVARIVVAAALAGLAGAGCAGAETEPDSGAADRVAVDTVGERRRPPGRAGRARGRRDPDGGRRGGCRLERRSSRRSPLRASSRAHRALGRSGGSSRRSSLAAATVWPRSYRAIAAQAPRREAARRQRAILLRAVRSEQQSLARLRRELRGDGDAWPPVLRFGARSDDLRRVLAGEIDAMMAAIPPNESAALRRAFAGG